MHIKQRHTQGFILDLSKYLSSPIIINKSNGNLRILFFYFKVGQRVNYYKMKLIIILALCATSFAGIVQVEEKVFFPNGKAPAATPQRAPQPVVAKPAPVPAPQAKPPPPPPPAPVAPQAKPPPPPPPPPPAPVAPQAIPQPALQVISPAQNPAPEKKPEVKPEEKPAAKPEPKPESKPEAKPEPKPEVKPEPNPARQAKPNNPHPHPESKPKPKPVDDFKSPCKVIDMYGYLTSYRLVGSYIALLLDMIPAENQYLPVEFPGHENLFMSFTKFEKVNIDQCSSYENFSMEKFKELFKDAIKEVAETPGEKDSLTRLVILISGYGSTGPPSFATLTEAFQITSELVQEYTSNSASASSTRMLNEFLPAMMEYFY